MANFEERRCSGELGRWIVLLQKGIGVMARHRSSYQREIGNLRSFEAYSLDILRFHNVHTKEAPYLCLLWKCLVWCIAILLRSIPLRRENLIALQSPENDPLQAERKSYKVRRCRWLLIGERVGGREGLKKHISEHSPRPVDNILILSLRHYVSLTSHRSILQAYYTKASNPAVFILEALRKKNKTVKARFTGKLGLKLENGWKFSFWLMV